MRAPVSRLSLDRRLAEAPEVKELICQHLADLQEALDDLMHIVNGEVPNRDMTGEEDGQAPSDEASMLLEIITESVKSLFRIGVLVRKTGTDDRFRRAIRSSNAVFPANFDINHAMEKYSKLRLRSAGLLATRVGSAISKRRQFIKYCRDHRLRLGYDEAAVIGDDEAAVIPEPEKVERARTELLSSKASTFHPERIPQGALMSEAFEEEKEEEDDDDAISLMTASTVSDPTQRLELPKLSDLSADGEQFECPICFTLQSFSQERAWRKHAFRDLKAYVCTVGGKECDSELFGDRNAWFEHELRQHRAQYACNLCSNQQLCSSEQELTSHA
ncbi:uncharacterized protein THITE_131090, partial [Thermothielavioides terrestris NRRL 8126]